MSSTPLDPVNWKEKIKIYNKYTFCIKNFKWWIVRPFQIFCQFYYNLIIITYWYTGEFRFHVLEDSTSRGKLFSRKLSAFIKNWCTKKRNIYISLLHIVAKKFSLAQVHTVERVCYFGNKKRLDLYLMVQKNLLRSTFTWYYLFSVFHRTKRWKNC